MFRRLGLLSILLLMLMACATQAAPVAAPVASPVKDEQAEQKQAEQLSSMATHSGDFAHYLLETLRPFCIEEYGEPYCYPIVHKVGFMGECKLRPHVENRWNWTEGFRLPNGPVWLIYFSDPYGEFTGYAHLSVGKWNITQTAMDLIPCWEEHGYWPIFPPGSHFVPYETPSVSENR